MSYFSDNKEHIICAAPECNNGVSTTKLHCYKHLKYFQKMYNKYKREQLTIAQYIENPSLLEKLDNVQLLRVMNRYLKVTTLRKMHTEQGFKPELQDMGHEKMIQRLLALADFAVEILTVRFNTFCLNTNDQPKSGTEIEIYSTVDENTIVVTIKQQIIENIEDITMELNNLIKAKQKWFNESKTALIKHADKFKLFPSMDLVNSKYCNIILSYCYCNLWQLFCSSNDILAYMEPVPNAVNFDNDIEYYFQDQLYLPTILDSLTDMDVNLIKAHMRLNVFCNKPVLYTYLEYQEIVGVKLIAFKFDIRECYSGQDFQTENQSYSCGKITPIKSENLTINFPMMRLGHPLSMLPNSVKAAFFPWILEGSERIIKAGKQSCLGLLIDYDGTAIYL